MALAGVGGGGGVGVGGVVLTGVAFGGLGVTMVFADDITDPEELDDPDELAELDATSRGRVRTAKLEASTPVRVGAGVPLATAAFEVPDDSFFVFWITRKPTPMSTMTAATITPTRRSQ